MYCLAAAGDEIMPVPQRLAGRAQSIGAGFRQPVERREVATIEPDTVADARHAVLIVEASTIAPVEQLASDVGRIEQPRLLIFDLMHAAAPATVTQRFPFAAIQRGQGFLPKRRGRVHGNATLALLSPADQAGFSGVKSVKKLSFVAGAAILLTAGSLAGAPQLTSKGYEFVHAVQERNGDKATQLLTENPAGIVDSRDGQGDTGLII